MGKYIKSNVVRIDELEKNVEILANAVQSLQVTNKVMQNLAKQTMANFTTLADEVKTLNRALADSQYAVQVLKRHATISEADLNAEAAALQIKDFEEAIAKEDAEENLLPASYVDEDSVIVITSSTPDLTPDQGFLRSRLDMQQVSIVDFRTKVLGKQVQESFECDINGTRHNVTLLSIKKKITNETSQDGLSLSETAH